MARGGEADRERSRRQGFPEWDVRILFPARDDAVAFEQRLEAEGIPVARRDAAMIAGAETEADANRWPTGSGRRRRPRRPSRSRSTARRR